MNARNPFPDADTLWDEIGRLYAGPGVQPRCLRLQDSYGLCVSLLLAMVALGERGIAIHEAAQPGLNALLQRWHYGVLVPLRQARRALKETDDALYDRARQMELALERRLLDEVVQVLRGRALWNADDALPRNLDLAVAAHGDLPDSAFAAADNLGRQLARPD